MNSTRLRFLLAALPLALLTACGGPQVPPAQNYGVISGRAYDAASNQPVAGAVITVDTILVATTGSDGSYRITAVPIGGYTMSGTPPSGYVFANPGTFDNGSISAGQTITIDVPLTKQ